MTDNELNSIPTPRTDAAMQVPIYRAATELAKTCRQLERELAIAEEALKEIEGRPMISPCDLAEETLRTLAELRKGTG